jgi:hypothetical protein
LLATEGVAVRVVAEVGRPLPGGFDGMQTLTPGDCVRVNWWNDDGSFAVEEKANVFRITNMLEVVAGERSILSFTGREYTHVSVDKELRCQKVYMNPDDCGPAQPMRMVREQVMLVHDCESHTPSKCVVRARCRDHRTVGHARDGDRGVAPQNIPPGGCVACVAARLAVYHYHPPRFLPTNGKEEVKNSAEWKKDRFLVLGSAEGFLPDLRWRAASTTVQNDR